MRSYSKLLAACMTLGMLASCTALAARDVAGTERAPLRASGAAASESHKDLLLTTHADAISALDLETRSSLRLGRDVITSPDLARVYERTIRHGRGVLKTRDSASGRLLSRTRIPRALEVAVASSTGDHLALIEPHEPSATPWLPAGKRHTRIAVVSPSGVDETRKLRLAGNFEIEAFSTDDRQLFLIEYMPAMNPWHYSVRRLELSSGEVRPIARRKQNAPGTMRGTGRVQAFAPDGSELYTLYTQQGPNYAHDKSHEGDDGYVYAFVHLLNLEGAWTHCIDLPQPFGTGAVTTHALALSPSGDRLFVIDPSSGGVAAVDPAGKRILKSVELDLRKLRAGEASAAVGPDNTLYVSGGRSLLRIEGDSLRLLDRRRFANAVQGIEVSGDGGRLYIAFKNRVAVVEASTGRRLQTIRSSGVEGLAGVVVSPK